VRWLVRPPLAPTRTEKKSCPACKRNHGAVSPKSWLETVVSRGEESSPSPEQTPIVFLLAVLLSSRLPPMCHVVTAAASDLSLFSNLQASPSFVCARRGRATCVGDWRQGTTTCVGGGWQGTATCVGGWAPDVQPIGVAPAGVAGGGRVLAA
jgi:hypothetical protein